METVRREERDGGEREYVREMTQERAKSNSTVREGRREGRREREKRVVGGGRWGLVEGAGRGGVSNITPHESVSVER
ncbi:hypothetical protein EYF80_067370 [Liparis tanakae]|uniref:Uncharacterized protein n=1 Tax=Liparis tanakae TaxID=230148 RepID=A0A4Z2E110_9TELE|nr:hypothetical protein EYF80_067370 [Liparis tanakae]